MARAQQDTVDKLIDLLSLPVGQNEGDERPESMEADIRRVSESLGRLVFEDDKWFEYDASRVEDVLENWLDDDTATRFDAAADYQPQEFLTWVETQVDTWKRGEAGAAGPAVEGAQSQSLGNANPDFAPHEVPGTEFYKYVNDEYVYAATEDAADDQWKTLEARYDEYRTGSPPEEGDGLLRGYPYTSSVLAGTAFYRQEGETYLYGPAEFAAAEEWKPYEYWQEKADDVDAAETLIREIDAFIELIDSRIADHQQ